MPQTLRLIIPNIEVMKQLRQNTDEQLVKNFMSGSDASLNTLINRHKKTVLSYIVRTTKNREISDDIFQDTFIKVVQNLKGKKYKENGKFLPWVMRISHNLIIDHYRSKKTPVISNDAYSYDILAKETALTSSEEDHIIETQNKEKIFLMIKDLPKEQREIIKMRYFWELSFKEIAEQTNVSINTALGRMRYALINLRKKMEEKQK